MNSQQTIGRSQDVGLFLIRAVLAVVFIYHGGQMLFGLFGGYGIHGTAAWMASVGIPFPTLSTVLSGCVQFLGGIILAFGDGTRLAAIPMAINMLVAILFVHRGRFDVRFDGMEYALTACVVLVALSLIGPGKFTLGHLISRAENVNDEPPFSRHAAAAR
jgi:putative oxidoreductase